MFCILCMKYDKRPYNQTTWNKIPCTRLRFQSIIGHENIAAHHDSVKVRGIEEVIVFPAVPMKRMEQAFTCLYFLIKHRVPQTII